jgi:serine O-acetyltransferase
MQHIKSKSDLKYFINLDSKNYPHNKFGDFLIQRPKYLTKKYLIYLRKSEYCLNVLQKKNIVISFYGRILQIYFRFKMRKLSWKLGFQFCENVLGPGVSIPAYGTIIINPFSQIGKNCVIYPGVTIGGKINHGYPIIGDNCIIGLGAKIIGKVKIGDNVIVAPNAVVVKNVESNSIVGGVPAKFIKYI